MTTRHKDVRRVLISSMHPRHRIAAREATILRGWRLSGPGPARFGWWAVWATGYAEYLGRNLRDVVNATQEPVAL